MSNAATAADKAITPADVQAHATTVFADGARCGCKTNWLTILIAVGVAAAIWLALHGLRRLGMRLRAPRSPARPAGAQ